MKELNIHALPENLQTVVSFIEDELVQRDCPQKALFQVAIAVEEIFINIAQYAYDPETGPATVRCEVIDEPLAVIIQFLDQGAPYNPLERQDPDVNCPLEERDLGGLGIFIVKNSMDSIDYEYRDGKNILTIRKSMR